MQVLGLQRRAEGEDPRRVFRELAGLLARGASALALLAWHWALLWAQDGQQWLQSKLARAG